MFFLFQKVELLFSEGGFWVPFNVVVVVIYLFFNNNEKLDLLSLLLDGILDGLFDLLVVFLGDLLEASIEVIDEVLLEVIDGSPDEEEVDKEPDEAGESVLVGEDGKEAEEEESLDGHADFLDEDDVEDGLEEGVDKVTGKLGRVLDPVIRDLDLLGVGSDGVLDLLLGDVLTIGDGAVANGEAEDGADEDKVAEEGKEGVAELHHHVEDDVEDHEGENREDDVLPVEDLLELLDNTVLTERSEGALAAADLLLDAFLGGFVLLLNNGCSLFRHFFLFYALLVSFD